MKLQFDPSQQYQLDAIKSITDIFKGQPNGSDFSLELSQVLGQLPIINSFLVGNKLLLEPAIIKKNLIDIQQNNNIEISDEDNLWNKELIWQKEELWDDNTVSLSSGMNFSVEMETGTGKTYVYLRTIHELYKQYGFKKFVIVVPSIAIKEGVIKNLQITKDHFSMLYENPEMDFYVYDPKKRGQLKNFATTNALQILVINIDSFAKFSASKKGKNIIYKNSDWGVPMEYIQGVKPIVIVDEPQNMETDIRKKAIKNLNPICTLRYSATHKHHYNLVYKLDPVDAYDLGLVKKIEVDSIVSEENYNQAFVELKSVHAQKRRVNAKVKIDVGNKNGVSKKIITVKVGDDLYKLSGERELYKNNYIIDEIDVDGEMIGLSNGKNIYVGHSEGDYRDEIMKFQIQKTIQNHLDREKKLQGKGIKVLSLFFIDKVANYRNYQDGEVLQGKFAEWFEEICNNFKENPKYKGLLSNDIDKIHNGYFSQDKKGLLKDTKGNTKVDDDTYALIMKHKEKLLSLDEPLRFIFSHSALREGWDNPNVFQICTLNESHSEMKKRQEIGRGLRLPVNQEGIRIFDENINVLTVIANESYEDFAKTLQTEIEEDCGVNFTGRIKNKAKKKKVHLKKSYALDENFKELWDKIKHKTRYQVEYNTEELIEKCAQELENVEIKVVKLQNTKVSLNLTREKVDSHLKSFKEKDISIYNFRIPNILENIQNKTNLTKNTILRIIKESGKIEGVFKNPQQFIDIFSLKINLVLNKMMIDGIKYERIVGDSWEMKSFENDELEGYIDNMYQVQNQEKTLYNYIICDSDIENKFAQDLESNEDVKFYIKLPYWFKIETPIGSYNPDWAVVFDGDKKIYFVVESKGKNETENLRDSEKLKIKCGEKHFEEFEDVEFKGPVKDVISLLS